MRKVGLLVLCILHLGFLNSCLHYSVEEETVKLYIATRDLYQDAMRQSLNELRYPGPGMGLDLMFNEKKYVAKMDALQQSFCDYIVNACYAGEEVTEYLIYQGIKDMGSQDIKGAMSMVELFGASSEMECAELLYDRYLMIPELSLKLVREEQGIKAYVNSKYKVQALVFQGDESLIAITDL